MKRDLSQPIRAAVIGGSLDGKTFLCSGIVKGWWRKYGYRTVVFDPFKGETDWGPQAIVFGSSFEERANLQADEANGREFQKFRKFISGIRPEHRFSVVWDESTDHGGRDRKNQGLLTAIRHNSNAFLVIGHSHASLLPGMRGSVSDIILSARDAKEAGEWASLMLDKDVLKAETLGKYEFLHKRKHDPVKILRFTKEEIERGVLL